jgi:hypothetical protein
MNSNETEHVVKGMSVDGVELRDTAHVPGFKIRAPKRPILLRGAAL